MLNTGKHTVKDQNQSNQTMLLLILIQSYLLLKLKVPVSNREHLNLEMSKNSNTEIRTPGKKVAYLMPKLRNLRMSTVQLKIILIIMKAYLRLLGKSLMIKKLQISQLKKNATKETLIQFQII